MHFHFLTTVVGKGSLWLWNLSMRSPQLRALNGFQQEVRLVPVLNFREISHSLSRPSRQMVAVNERWVYVHNLLPNSMLVKL
jgi:hypothetical protein